MICLTPHGSFNCNLDDLFYGEWFDLQHIQAKILLVLDGIDGESVHYTVYPKKEDGYADMEKPLFGGTATTSRSISCAM